MTKRKITPPIEEGITAKDLLQAEYERKIIELEYKYMRSQDDKIRDLNCAHGNETQRLRESIEYNQNKTIRAEDKAAAWQMAFWILFVAASVFAGVVLK